MLFLASFHFLITIPLGATGIRVSLSDMFLPVFIVILVIKFSMGNITFKFNSIFVWLLVISIWLTVSLITGYLHTGQVTSWGLVNKYIGWYVLIGYLIIGGFIWRIKSDVPNYFFLKSFVVTTWGVAIIEIVHHVLVGAGVIDVLPETRIDGFSGNSNAYGLIVTTSLIIQIVYYKNELLFSKRLMVAGILLSLLALALTISRGAWLGFICASLSMLWFKKIPLKETLYTIVISIIVVNLFLLSNSNGYFKGRDNRLNKKIVTIDHKYIKEKLLTISEGSISQRIDTAKSGINQWSKFPMQGIGLGSFYISEIKRTNNPERSSKKEFPLTLHNTFLWLLVETGLIGALLISAFVIYMLVKILSNIKGHQDDDMKIIAFSILMAAIGCSIAMEVMYQRYIWLFLGCALSMIKMTIINEKK
jgi:O-antigen ligase